MPLFDVDSLVRNIQECAYRGGVRPEQHGLNPDTVEQHKLNPDKDEDLVFKSPT